jgi:hypothetical protein
MYAKRLTALPPYLFAAIDEAKENAIKRGVDVIDLGVGDSISASEILTCHRQTISSMRCVHPRTIRGGTSIPRTQEC